MIYKNKIKYYFCNFGLFVIVYLRGFLTGKFGSDVYNGEVNGSLFINVDFLFEAVEDLCTLESILLMLLILLEGDIFS